jgi:hypothetical protein
MTEEKEIILCRPCRKDYMKMWFKKHPNYWHEYYKKKPRKNTEQYYANNKEKVKHYATVRYYKNKKHMEEIMNDLKINGCSICGYNNCTYSLEFHHVIPEDKNKKIKLTMNGLFRYNDMDIINELNKCILLCSNCHREIEWKTLK